MTGQAIPAIPAPQGTHRSDAVRLFAGFAGLGAAAVNLAVASSLFAAAGANFPGRVGGAAAALLWGAALLGWTVAGLSRNRFPMPRASALLLPAAAAVHVAAIVFGAGSGMAGLGISHLAAVLLTLMIRAATSWLSRESPNLSGAPGQNTSGRLGAGTLLAAAFAGAVLVAAITTPGLAASTAGQFAVPHGEHTGSHHSP
ncbi:hypothetical protein [Arthrobacter globiformis]|uniref:Uncharacterized protein n=1 Tax=Arthrobacter globiformis TaxID=1665 RepID=A0A328HKX0_ARTGO|nr:hypothetical protein [Arthrobacter globiformis]RAM39277.1 hypothetical protein DBZ45_00610 [Arthrobacter globiformis]